MLRLMGTTSMNMVKKESNQDTEKTNELASAENFAGMDYCNSTVSFVAYFVMLYYFTHFTQHTLHMLCYTDKILSNIINTDPYTWIIDSGASDNVTFSIKNFTHNIRKYDSFVLLPNLTKIKVTHIGDIKVNKHLTLYDVLYIPYFHVNLLSISKVNNTNDISFLFTKNFCVIQTQFSSLMIGKTWHRHGLYHIKICKALSAEVSSSSPVSSVFQIAGINHNPWHFRLGHLSNEKLKLIEKNSAFVQSSSFSHCDICNQAKLRRSSFPINDKVLCSNWFDLIHCDIWGPFSVASLHNHHYFLTIVDDHTRFTWTFLMKYKSDTRQVLQNFIVFIENHLNVQLKTIRSDNGLEFQMTDFYSSKGILHQQTCVYTPQQNGVVERKHQHLLNVARSLLFQSSLPLKFWGHAILHATYLFNRTPTPILHNLTPFQLLNHTIPSYKHIKVFGCLAYAATIKDLRHKFQSRARTCVFLGFPANVKGYILYDMDLDQVFISRDVVFVEHIFPFSSTSKMNDNPSFPIGMIPVSTPPVIDHTSDIHTDLPTIPTASDSSISSENLNSVPPTRVMTRAIKIPARFNDYHHAVITRRPDISITNYSTSYPIHSYITYDRLSDSQYHYTLQLSLLEEPKSYSEALQYPHWQQAIQDELQAMENNNTWTVTSLPEGYKPIGCKFVFKTKLKSDGTLDKYKARLVAQGFT